MLKKSLLLATFLVSTTFGAALPDTASDGAVAAASSAAVPESSDASLDAAGIRRLMDTVSPIGFTHTPESKARAVSELTRLAGILLSNQTIAESDPSLLLRIGHRLHRLDGNDAAIRVFEAVIQLRRDVFGSFMATTCFKLHELGKADLAITTLRSLFSDSSLNTYSREIAILVFFAINPDAHQSEAIELLTNLWWQIKKFETLEEAAAAARDELSLNDSNRANFEETLRYLSNLEVEEELAAEQQAARAAPSAQ